MKERIIKAFSTPAKLGASIDHSRQSAELRIKNGNAATVYLDGKKVGYADLDNTIFALVVNKTFVKKGWPKGKKRTPLQVTEVQGNQVHELTVSDSPA